MKRIPPKGTPEYHAYWRDRHILESLKAQREQLAYAVENAESARKVLFSLSLHQFDRAIAAFDAGHQFSYT